MIADQVSIDVAGLSNAGSRKNNEDAFLLADFRNQQTFNNATRITRPLADNSFLLVVSDGVGGAALGEVASQLTVYAINEALNRLSASIPAPDRLIAAVEQANHVVFHESKRNPAYKGMAATATAVLVEGERAYVAEVGDSRAYLFRDGRTIKLTTDQSLVEVLIAKGIIKPEQAINHPRKNVILQSIGPNEAIQVAVGQLTLQRGDYLLLCTDGLSNNVLEHEMLQTLKSSADLTKACEQLIALANERGSKDNITTVVAQFDGEGLPLVANPQTSDTTVEIITSFDPERRTEKSHKRTMLLGEMAEVILTNSTKVLDNLHGYPARSDISAQYQQLDQLLNQALRIISAQQQEMTKVSEWVTNEVARYPRLEDLDGKLISAQENIERAWRSVREIMAEFDQTIN